MEGDQQFTKDGAASLQSVFWFCQLSGRFGGILIAKFVNIKYIVLGDAIGALVTSVLLVKYGNDNVTALWILVGMLGFFVSFAYPAGQRTSDFNVGKISGGSRGHPCP